MQTLIFLIKQLQFFKKIGYDHLLNNEDNKEYLLTLIKQNQIVKNYLFNLQENIINYSQVQKYRIIENFNPLRCVFNLGLSPIKPPLNIFFWDAKFLDATLLSLKRILRETKPKTLEPLPS